MNDLSGQVFVFFILAIAATESAVGLAIIVLIYRNRKSINIKELSELKG
jgi:NADH-quinone oxidoreductase subunit K